MEHVDFDDWLKVYKFKSPIYYIQFDKDGKVSGLYPFYHKKDDNDLIEIEEEIALRIQEGKISLSSCAVDVLTKTFIPNKNKKLRKIELDGPLHRIVEEPYAEDKKHDLFITYRNKKLKFELAKKYGGTKTTEEKDVKKIMWGRDTEIRFLVTEYNDPHVVYKNIEFKIGDLLGRHQQIGIPECPENFSIYTRRLFPNYVISKK